MGLSVDGTGVGVRDGLSVVGVCVGLMLIGDPAANVSNKDNNIMSKNHEVDMT